MSEPNVYTGAAPRESRGVTSVGTAPTSSGGKAPRENGPSPTVIGAGPLEERGTGGARTTPPVPTGATLDRRSFLGASEIAAVVGLHPWKSALDVWAAKIHGIEATDSPVMRAGRELERPILERLYAAPRGVAIWYPGTFRLPGEPWAGATPDAFEPLAQAAVLDLECKLVGRGQFARWGDEPEGADAIPPEVLCQIHWQMLCGGAAAGCAVALLGTELRVYDVPRDAEFAANLLDLGRAWWRRHVEGGEMPEVTASSRETLRRLFPRASGALLAMREDVRDLASEYLAARDAAKAAEEARETAGARLCAAIGDAEGFEAADLRVTWKEQRGRIAYSELVKALRIPAAEQEQFRADAFRVLRVHSKGDE